MKPQQLKRRIFIKILKMKNFKKFQIAILVFMFSYCVKANNETVFFEKADYFFKLYVSNNNKVDYDLIKKDPSLLNELVNVISLAEVSTLEKNNYKAFWINTYNILVIKGIVTNNFPINSVKDVKGFFDRRTFIVGGEELTLNKIEKYKLRTILNDSFLNFVLVCAANGCPPLINKAYTPENIDKQLEDQVIKSINNPKFIRVNKKEKTVQISQIFDWYRPEFINQDERIIDFINKYRTEKIDINYSIEYYKYDWSLNTKN